MSENEHDEVKLENASQSTGNDSGGNSATLDSQNVLPNQTVGSDQQPITTDTATQSSLPTVDNEPGVAGFGAEAINLEEVVTPTEEDTQDDSGKSKRYIPLNAEVTKVFRQIVDAVDDNYEVAFLPADDLERLKEINESVQNIDTETQEVQDWVNALSWGIVTSPYNKAYLKKLRSPDALWRQSLKVNDKVELAAGAPKYQFNASSTILSGEDAVRRIHSSIGIGTYIQVPLYGSGFWATIKAPETDSLLDLNRQIAESKITLGRKTFGSVLSNNTVYMANIMMSFIKAHIYDSTIAGANTINYTDYIKANDFPTLMWAMASLIWKNGFQYKQACVADPKACTHVINALLDVSKLLWVNNNAFTDQQKIHMAKRAGSVMSLDSLKLYTEQFPFTAAQRFTIGIDKVSGKNIDVELSVPSMTDFINNGMEWIDKIIFFVDKAMADSDPEVRIAQYLNHAKATRMRQYGHYVSRIYIDEYVIEKRDDINKALDIYSNDDTMTDALLDHVRDFITDSTVSVFGIPHSPCPNCEKDRETLPGTFSSLVPVDIFSTFFILLAPKVNRIQAREF